MISPAATEVKTKNRAISIDKLLKTKFKSVDFSGEWEHALGNPEAAGVWIIWGNSGNGKTNGSLKLAKIIAAQFKVGYNSLEEGARKSMQMAINRAGIKDVQRRFQLLHREDLEDFKVRLRNRKSAKVWFIDSIQHFGITKRQYKALKNEFPEHLFIFISHAEGTEPLGDLAKHIRYDADVKIRCEGFKFFIQSRLGEHGEPVGEVVINPQKADKYWGEFDKIKQKKEAQILNIKDAKDK